jgi:hypothetical protein
MTRCLGCAGPAANRHHVLAQTHLRKHARSECRPDKRAITNREAALIADKRNMVPMCFDCHMSHENWSKRLTREQVPESAWEFARELGEWAVVRLENDYPRREAA